MLRKQVEESNAGFPCALILITNSDSDVDNNSSCSFTSPPPSFSTQLCKAKNWSVQAGNEQTLTTMITTTSLRVTMM